ncbi:MAG: hypothetical protein LBM77_09725 [Spirochaetaceae bacterium]|jgi:ABC-type dipeptide/oligopeptide/nickel transport system ATPase component|nr:hypothetical protein [Spirochaetaceae bacterium]
MSYQNEILKQLRELNKTTKAAFVFITKKPNVLLQVLEVIATIVGIGSIVGVIAQIMLWIKGGF